jgi:hypothetical protein
LVLLACIASFGLMSGCGKGWEMDYGEPVAQFLQEDVGQKGKAFLGKKVTVKGTVTKVDVGDPDAAWIHLEGGIRCVHLSGRDEIAWRRGVVC